jgi:hypothetical protein
MKLLNIFSHVAYNVHEFSSSRWRGSGAWRKLNCEVCKLLTSLVRIEARNSFWVSVV